MLDMKTETFLCACRQMNFTRAAETLHITQSAVSQQIHALERYYDAKLFYYEKRVLHLTPAGEYLRGYLETVDHDIRRIRDLLPGQNRTPALKIGTTMSVGDFFMPDLIARFLKSEPQVRLSVTRLDTHQILELLNSGELDFAFVEGDVSGGAYAVRPIAEVDMVAVCGRDYPLPEVRTVADLFSVPLLLREEGSGTREIFAQELRLRGFDLRDFTHCSVFNSPLLIKNLLLQNCGFSFLYRTVVEDCLQSGALRVVSVPGFAVQHAFYAIWRRESRFCSYYETVIQEMLRR